jgi:NAD(P)-dependent dehydrogenase (short-subunit alcohol dehydrogenase family)
LLDRLRRVFRTHAAPFPDGADALAAFRPEEIEKWKELVGRTDFGKGIEGTMTKQLLDRVAIVTGASNGIGRGIAEALAAAGAKTALAARRTEMLVEVASGIRSAGGTALPVTTDVTREDQVAQLFRKTYETYGRVDVLVNNAGVPTHVPIEDITLRYWQEVLDVNLTAAFLCSREAVKIMKSQTPQGGRIINIGSVSAKTPRADSLPYTATKFALQGMTHQLTMDGRKYGVVASILHPGATLSSFSTRRGRTKAGPGATPDDYVMAAEDVAKIVVLMCSLPPEVNLYEATILPNHMRSFIGRG